MALIATSVLFIFGLVAVSATPTRYELGFRALNCRRCELSECFLPPGGRCEYGQFNDNCGYVNCYRGPGEVCSHSKRCGDDLTCLCGKCTGCYLENDEPECYIHSSACTSHFV